MKYTKLFNNHNEYTAFTASTSFITPNVSWCKLEEEAHLTPIEPVETRVVAKFNVTDTSNPTPIGYSTYISGFSSIEIDGVEQPSVVSAYTFSTTGEHTVKYTLTDPSSIGSRAFRSCSGLTSVTIPNSVTRIGTVAFAYCPSLASVTIPNSVTSIGYSTFESCSGLTSVTIPNSVTIIDDYTFYGCSSLTSVTIPNSVTSILTYAFAYCSGLISIASLATTAPTISNSTFRDVKTNGTLYVPQGSTGYNAWMWTSNYYLGKYNWTKVEQ